MRILFITSNRLGDAVLSTGLLHHLIDERPQAHFTIACGPVAQGVFARMPNRERTIVLDKRPYRLHWPDLWFETVTTIWDLVVDIRGSAIAWMIPARRRAVMRSRTGPKIAQLAALLRLDPPPLPMTWTAPEDQTRAATLLPADRPVIALAPTANWRPKVWPPERFAALFHELTAGPLPGAIPAVFAGPGHREREMASPLLAALPESIDLTGQLSVPEAAACLARTALFVGNDSGLMHLAAAAGAPTLGLFGPTDAAEYAPSGRRTAAVIAPTLQMQDLSVVQAFTAAADLLRH
ncbi:MAG TPA: glycosyltransferase family 9 protein [Acetobacteraceae bacterium]|jgi:heptosyltransferase III|nr:glycosyltransferase family 9 protein [Acetobacteraceae bacterium]